jgi:hypothetical protein
MKEAATSALATASEWCAPRLPTLAMHASRGINSLMNVNRCHTDFQKSLNKCIHALVQHEKEKV